MDVSRATTDHVERRIFGCPGTGKTTTLSKLIAKAVAKMGSERLIVSSFTRAAAAELVSRGLPIRRDQVATLHAHAYRSIGRPDLVETPKNIKEWNNWVVKYDEDYMLSGGAVDPDDPYSFESNSGKTEGDRMLARYNTLRARLVPEDDYMREDVSRFRRLWEQFKAETATIDFTDMIALAVRDVDTAPFDPAVGFFDEAQDFTPLELKLVRKWARKMEYIILSGDDDQCIYAFKGATPEAFLDPPIHESFKHVLPQSWRVPEAVHRLATRFVKQLSRREDKVYKPRFECERNEFGERSYDTTRTAVGAVRYIDASFGSADHADMLIEDAVEKYLNKGKTVMFLTACSYQLENLRSQLRSNGLLYHNPYRKSNGAWNPLGQGKSAQRILAYLAPRIRHNIQAEDTAQVREALIKRASIEMDSFNSVPLWTRQELELWLEMVRVSGVLKRGAIKAIANDFALDDEEITASLLSDYFVNTSDLVLSAHGLMSWLRDKAKEDYSKRLTYFANIVRKGGADALKAKPKIIIGTIHSVKGGEADAVYLCPDLSYQGWQQYQNSGDEIVRQFYVAMTRAFEHLIICDPHSNMHVDLF